MVQSISLLPIFQIEYRRIEKNVPRIWVGLFLWLKNKEDPIAHSGRVFIFYFYNQHYTLITKNLLLQQRLCSLDNIIHSKSVFLEEFAGRT